MPQATKPAVEPQTPAAASAPPTAAKQAKPEAAKESASAPQVLPNSELSIESIGWLFLQKYYGTYTADMSKLFTFYDAGAAVLHEAFPSENTDDNTDGKAVKTVHVAKGSDSVKSFFDGQGTSASSSALEKSKIVVENATFQNSVDESILIVVSGSWKRGSSNLCQFVQTFVLKAKGKTVYDIANDVLKFIDLALEYKETITKVVEEKPTEKVAEKAADEVLGESPAEDKSESKSEHTQTATETATETQKETAVETKEPESKKDELSVSENVPSTKEEQPKQENKPEVTETEQSPLEKKEDEKPTEPVKPAAPAIPAQKPTWASLAAIGPKTAPKNSAVVSPVVSKTATASPLVAVPAPAAKKPSSPSQTTPQAPVNGKYKKEEWYPIYIKNVDVEEDELKAAIIKQFGDVKFFKKSNKTALCDFKSKEDQQRALEMKEMVIKSNVILLEPRIHKVYNNGKVDAKKDKKNVKKNGFKKN